MGRSKGGKCELFGPLQTQAAWLPEKTIISAPDSLPDLCPHTMDQAVSLVAKPKASSGIKGAPSQQVISCFEGGVMGRGDSSHTHPSRRVKGPQHSPVLLFLPDHKQVLIEIYCG